MPPSSVIVDCVSAGASPPTRRLVPGTMVGGVPGTAGGGLPSGVSGTGSRACAASSAALSFVGFGTSAASAQRASISDAASATAPIPPRLSPNVIGRPPASCVYALFLAVMSKGWLPRLRIDGGALQRLGIDVGVIAGFRGRRGGCPGRLRRGCRRRRCRCQCRHGRGRRWRSLRRSRRGCRRRGHWCCGQRHAGGPGRGTFHGNDGVPAAGMERDGGGVYLHLAPARDGIAEHRAEKEQTTTADQRDGAVRI